MLMLLHGALEKIHPCPGFLFSQDGRGMEQVPVRQGPRLGMKHMAGMGENGQAIDRLRLAYARAKCRCAAVKNALPFYWT